MEEAAITEPLWSTTVPLMDPSTVWAAAGRTARNNAATNTDMLLRGIAHQLLTGRSRTFDGRLYSPKRWIANIEFTSYFLDGEKADSQIPAAPVGPHVATRVRLALGPAALSQIGEDGRAEYLDRGRRYSARPKSWLTNRTCATV